MKILLLLLFAAFNFILYSAFATEFCDNSRIGKTAVFANGRIKPFLVHAKDRMMFITEDKKEVERNAVKNFCELSLGDRENYLNTIQVKIYHNEIKSVLRRDENSKIIFIKLSDFINFKNEFISLARKTSDKRLQDLLGSYQDRIGILQGIMSGQDFKLFVGNKWQYIHEIENSDQIVKYLVQEKNYLTSRVLLEFYNLYFRPFLVSMIILILSILVLFIAKEKGMVLFLSFMALDIQFLSIVVRGYVAQRIPFSNMYETVMLAGFVSNILGIWFYFKWKEKSVLLSGIFLNIFTLFMLEFSTGMLDASIHPLMPVLKNNFWLGIHVFTVMVAYAAFGFSWFMSNFFIVRDFFSDRDAEATTKFLRIVSDAIRFGVIFLSAGILTGGMWADFAWGRFWGWDPKEVWSLIVLLVYMMILHGRYTNWIGKTTFVVVAAPAFLSVMTAWFGVNYVLATGLHSYGFSRGGTIFFTVFVVSQLFISLLHLFKINFFKGIN